MKHFRKGQYEEGLFCLIESNIFIWIQIQIQIIHSSGNKTLKKSNKVCRKSNQIRSDSERRALPPHAQTNVTLAY